MKKSKKYDYHIIKNEDSWSVEIIRRVTAKKTLVSKRENGFTSELDAHAWGKAEVEAFLNDMNLNEQRKRRAKNNEQGEDIV